MSTTPYMSLVLPDPSVTVGPDWAEDLNTALEVVDAHNHASGNGVLVPTAGLNINEDLAFNSHNVTGLRSVRMTTQASPLGLATDRGCAYVSGADLWFNDTAGNQIQLTASGALNAASIGGIGGDYSTSSASVAYNSTTKFFTFLQASLTPSKMDTGPITLRNATASSFGIVLAPAVGIGADYNLTLPAAVPGATTFVTCDSSGNLAFSNSGVSLALSAGATIGTTLGVTGATTLTGALTANGSVTLGDAAGDTLTINATPTAASANGMRAATTRATGTSVAAGGVAISSASGDIATTSTSYVDATNLSVTITTSGRPVFITLVSNTPGGLDGVLTYVLLGGSHSNVDRSYYKMVRDSTDIFETFIIVWDANVDSVLSVPCGSFIGIDTVAAGTYTYKVQYKSTAANVNTKIQDCKLVAYEL